MKKSNKPVVLVLYVISILLGVYTIVTVYSSYTYIASLVSQGLVISEELLNVVNYFVDNSAPYLFYAISTWALGYIINKINFISNEMKMNSIEDLEDEAIIITSNEEICDEIDEEIIEEIVDEVSITDDEK